MLLEGFTQRQAGEEQRCEEMRKEEAHAQSEGCYDVKQAYRDALTPTSG